MHHLHKILTSLPSHVRLVAVSKTILPDVLMEVYRSGHRVFGENRAQELIAKQPLLPADIQWHFIGHLQTNKVKYIAPFVEMIESVDSLKLLKEINKEAAKNERVIKCLLQFHIAKEETKYGLDIQEAEELMAHPDLPSMHNIIISGVMGMATFTEDEGQVRQEFRKLKKIFDDLKDKHFPDNPSFCEISMGMSDDYRIAVEEGSTIVRLGSAIFF
ncbi:MAG: YggS family pyridoxal phosphate-dependent enzyme [Bacteroidales bacterium]|nr:YggS family pyridoxal phosphate-dependent enzyme [Bacteroidales bacterium]